MLPLLPQKGQIEKGQNLRFAEAVFGTAFKEPHVAQCARVVAHLVAADLPLIGLVTKIGQHQHIQVLSI